jgi:hypothetical protein
VTGPHGLLLAIVALFVFIRSISVNIRAKLEVDEEVECINGAINTQMTLYDGVHYVSHKSGSNCEIKRAQCSQRSIFLDHARSITLPTGQR